MSPPIKSKKVKLQSMWGSAVTVAQGLVSQSPINNSCFTYILQDTPVIYKILTDFVSYSVIEGIYRMWVNHPPKCNQKT